MGYAKSIFLGGQKIRADDPRLNSSSYRELLLRCTYCMEPVYYKKGEVNQPHFAHFHSLEPKKYEECLLRQQNINSNFSPSMLGA
jgi:competence CoiA-like predicted nuclease